MRLFKKKQQTGRQPQLMAGQNDYVFRRSRTLTGSVSAQVTTPAASRGQLKTDRLKLHELKAHRRKILRMLGVVLLIIACISFLLANFIISPSIIASQPSDKPVQSAAYRDTMYSYFADHPMERFGFLLNQTNIERYIKQKHTEIQTVSVERDWYGGNVRIDVFFRTPLLVWKTGNQQFYVDNQGIAFAYNHFAEPAVAVTDQTGLPPDQSGAVASTRFIRFLGRMVGAVNDYGKGKVTAVIIPPSTREIDLKLEGREYLIKTNSDRDPLQQAEDIATALTHLDQKGIKPQYIDLRVAHKAFYK
jgi:cell division septal protein FtsQ